MFPIRCLILMALLAFGGIASAQSASLFPRGESSARAPLIALRTAAQPKPARPASLFADERRLGFFAPMPDAGPAPAQSPGPLTDKSAVARLRSLIAEAEAGPDGYDAIIRGARVKPPKRPTELTVQEILDWIAATPGQPHAIGRYQFIPDTLRFLVAELNIDKRTRFTPELQDRLADQLLADAGFLAFQRGEITRRSFMYRLAKVWAGLPLPSGESYYEGYAGNKATMTWARFDGAMAAIFPG
ncbi:lysozyme family protein [Mameliella alba]|uniref:Transglycosylase SLT domain-containing protein n=1 Tax=Mameliella alba TaxID=561184 RepID=A0A0B3RVD0_9RHOB|nr:hypothetical protein [Mameliella alba]KHQ54885.1 hypothetical protein OA50_00721 [Mameliella alba]